jgi:hypothetical protein
LHTKLFNAAPDIYPIDKKVNKNPVNATLILRELLISINIGLATVILTATNIML